MPKEQFSPNDQESSVSADVFADLLGDKIEDPLYRRLLDTWRRYGAEAAKQFCINDADKFPENDNDAVRSFLERELFDAGEDGLDKKRHGTHTGDRKQDYHIYIRLTSKTKRLDVCQFSNKY